MNEELSMERIVRDSSIDMLSFVYHEKYATIYCVPFRVTHDNIRPTQNPLSTEEEHDINNHDDKKRKLVLFLHGPKEVVLNLFSRFSSIESEISHLVSIPVEKVSVVFPRFFPYNHTNTNPNTNTNTIKKHFRPFIPSPPTRVVI
jgi:hypothetical protein